MAALFPSVFQRFCHDTMNRYQAVVRMEEGQPQDIVALLNNMDQSLKRKSAEINVLNEELFQVKSAVYTLARQ